jgi:hypothetical protein
MCMSQFRLQDCEADEERYVISTSRMSVQSGTEHVGSVALSAVSDDRRGIRETDSYCAGDADRSALETCKTNPVIHLS